MERMYNHEPEGYRCPFCLVAEGIENEHVYTTQQDIIYRNEFITAFIAATWMENNKGHVIIIPNQHFENLYDLPLEVSHRIHDFEREVAIALKETYHCNGVSTRQHNEPCGNQDVWHYHLHVFPRYENDNLYTSGRVNTKPEERLEYAAKLREYFSR